MREERTPNPGVLVG
jgi:hypothetical protein